MKPRPYIGITDFPTWETTQRMIDCFKKNQSGIPHALHIGIMCSYKSLNGHATKYDDVWPESKYLSNIFPVTGSEPVFNCLHYADYGTTPYKETVKTIVKGLNACGAQLHGLQLDMIWPDFAAIWSALRLSFNNSPLKVILQINSRAFEMMDNDPKKVVEKLREYRDLGLLNYVLLDKSMGKGQPLDARFMLPFLREIQEQFPDVGLVVAGGLGPDTLDLLCPILEEFPGISIDAQGRLRPSFDSTKPIDWNMAERYVKNATDLFRKYIR